MPFGNVKYKSVCLCMFNLLVSSSFVKDTTINTVFFTDELSKSRSVAVIFKETRWPFVGHSVVACSAARLARAKTVQASSLRTPLLLPATR